MKKITFLINSSQVCFYFRRELIHDLKERSYEVTIIVGDDKYVSNIEQLGVKVYSIPLVRRSINIFKSFAFKKKLKEILKTIEPDCFFSFQIKPIVFGNSVAKSLKIKNIFSMVEGLGDGFSKSSLKYRLAEIYLSYKIKYSFRYANKVFVMNQEDIDFLVNKKLLDRKKAVLINGTGIDLEEYPYKEMKCFNSVVMISRLIRAKGIFDFCEAARICKEARPDVKFTIIGHEDDVKKNELEQYISNNDIEYLGVVPDLSEALELMSIFVLPTYYNEGFPRSILEAMATGRAVVTTDSKGCNVAVQNNYNGLLVRARDPKNLAEAILSLISDKEKMIQFGKNGRLKAENEFASRTINKFIIGTIEENTNN